MCSYKKLIFLTCYSELQHFDFDSNYLPRINCYNAKLSNELISKDKKYSIANEKASFDRIKKKYPSLINVPQTEWSNLLKQIRNRNHTRTPNIIIDSISGYLSTDSIIVTRIINGNLNAINDILLELQNEGFRPSPISLVSKICKWIYRWSSNNNDQFHIYDSIVKSVIPYYAKIFDVNIVDKDLDNYLHYSEIVKSISNKANVSLHSVDQILWYFYRKNPIQKEIAIALA